MKETLFTKVELKHIMAEQIYRAISDFDNVEVPIQQISEEQAEFTIGFYGYRFKVMVMDSDGKAE